MVSQTAWKTALKVIPIIAVMPIGFMLFLTFRGTGSSGIGEFEFYNCNQGNRSKYGNTTGLSQNPIVLLRSAPNPVVIHLRYGQSDTSQQLYTLSIVGANGTTDEPQKEGIVAHLDKSFLLVPPSSPGKLVIEHFNLYLAATNSAKQGIHIITVMETNPKKARADTPCT